MVDDGPLLSMSVDSREAYPIINTNLSIARTPLETRLFIVPASCDVITTWPSCYRYVTTQMFYFKCSGFSRKKPHNCRSVCHIYVTSTIHTMIVRSITGLLLSNQVRPGRQANKKGRRKCLGCRTFRRILRCVSRLTIAKQKSRSESELKISLFHVLVQGSKVCMGAPCISMGHRLHYIFNNNNINN